VLESGFANILSFYYLQFPIRRAEPKKKHEPKKTENIKLLQNFLATYTQEMENL